MTPTIKERLQRYASELYSWNRRYALLSRQDVVNVLSKHVAASLGVLLLVEPEARTKWVDVGSGAGLPGLVLKIWAPDQEIVLIEGSRRKCVFMQNIARMLDLGSLDVLALRVETLIARGERLENFDILYSRAVANITATLEYFGPLVRSGGCIITFKGPSWSNDVQQARMQGLLVAGRYRLEDVLVIPWAPGHILQIRKENG